MDPLTIDQISKITAVEPGSTVRAIKNNAQTAAPILESPDERLNSALSEINESVGAELLEMIMQATPKFFEFLVLDLLYAMGYGASRADLQRVGGTGDAGIDGVTGSASKERIVLIDGARLTGLMIEHGVGVSHRVVKVPKVDGDYFVLWSEGGKQNIPKYSFQDWKSNEYACIYRLAC